MITLDSPIAADERYTVMDYPARICRYAVSTKTTSVMAAKLATTRGRAFDQ